MNTRIGGIYKIVKKQGVFVVGGFLLAILSFVILNAAMEPVSKSEYCGGKCHEMHTAYQSWELSVHGSNKYGVQAQCIDCHLPAKDKYFTHIAAKAYEGGKDLYKHYFGDRYDVEKMREHVLERIGNDRCQSCHNDLLGKPSNSNARIAHAAVLNNPEAPENRCVVCHENMHERKNKLFPAD